jgi:hypothetical protein
MPKGGRRTTTWQPGWKSGKTTVIRVPEALTEKLLEAARVLDEGSEIDYSVTNPSKKSLVTDNTLEEAADAYLMTISPKDRRNAKRIVYGFLKSIAGNIAL